MLYSLLPEDLGTPFVEEDELQTGRASVTAVYLRGLVIGLLSVESTEM